MAKRSESSHWYSKKLHRISNNPHNSLVYTSIGMNLCIHWVDRLSVILSAVISDIKVLPIIKLDQQIAVEFGEILNITLSKDVIYNVNINMDNFDRLFREMPQKYDFCIRVDKGTFECGKSDGSGLQSDLYKAFSELNRLIQTLSSK